jgi:galactan 5-O-arabinofuranosyltransferase
VWPALEALVAFAAPSLFLATCVLIRTNPRDRLGQISGIASLELRFFMFAIALLVVMVLAARRQSAEAFERTTRLVCAAFAGLATGLIAGGILVALRGTPFGLHTNGGDISALIQWAQALDAGKQVDPLYPPVSVYLLSAYHHLAGVPYEQAVKHLQIAGTLAFGPIAYLSWRMLLRPGWALGIAVVAVLPLVDPYKPYTHLVLAAFVPLAIVTLQTIRDIESKTVGQLVRTSALLGLAFGILCISYSGWFQWSAPGLFVAFLVVMPWRTAWKPALASLGIIGGVFLLVAGRYLIAALSVKVLDTFIYSDVRVEPTYIAMWRNDLPGPIDTWPPIGEFAGVGLFTLVLAAGFAFAVALGRRTVAVLTLGTMMAGAWLMRFWYAKDLWATKLVQLYPRTAPLILYCLMVSTGLALCWAIERRSTTSAVRGRGALIGGLCGLALVFASAGSVITDRYMPSNTNPPGPGVLAWNAHAALRATKARTFTAKTLPWVRREILPVPPAVPLSK